MNLTLEAIATQLGYQPTEAIMQQWNKVAKNTRGFERIAQHIVPLNDALKHTDSYIALSSSHDYLKIKVEAPTPELAKEAKEIIAGWAEKYKVELQKVEGKETFYIIGYSKH